MEQLDKEIYLQYLRQTLEHENFYKGFTNAIRLSKAVVAGGSVLAAYSNFKTSDIDIYVNINNAKKLYNKLQKGFNNGFKIIHHNFAPAYDESFFAKNNILGRFRLEMQRDEDNLLKIDIMILPTDVQIVNVVQNFDLTFCEVWFDGINVYATDSEGIRNKTGNLRPEYEKSLLVNFNQFILDRIKKYSKRGFVIKYNCNGEKTVSLPKKNVSNYERWIVSVLYKQILAFDFVKSRQSYRNKEKYIFNSFVTNKLEKYTVENLKNILMNYSNVKIRVANEEQLKKLYLKSFYFIGLEYFVQTLGEEKANVYFDNILRYTGITKEEILNYDDEDDEDDEDEEESEDENQENEEKIRKKIIEIFLESNADEEYYKIMEKINGYLSQNNLNLSRENTKLCEILENVWEKRDDLENLEIDESNLPDTCTDLIMMDTYNVTEYLAESNDSIMFVNIGSDNTFSIICYTKEYLKQAILNYDTTWFYECNGPMIPGTNDRRVINYSTNEKYVESTTYIKLPIQSGVNIVIPLSKIFKLIQTNKRIFYVIAMLDENGNKKVLTHTVSYQNVYSNQPNYVSANHCQDRSNEFVYDIKICGGINCVVGARLEE